MSDPNGGTPEQIKARLKVYDRIGSGSGYAVMAGLCGMAVTGIWHSPAWAFNSSASLAAVGGILLAFMLMNYSGAKALLKEADHHNHPRGR